MEQILLSAFSGFISGVILYFFITRPKLKKIKEYNSEIEEKNKELE